MFKNTISVTPLTTEEANEYFDSINGSAWRRDTTFLTTLRALLEPRMGKDDRVNLYIEDRKFTRSTFEQNSGVRRIKEVAGSYVDMSNIILVMDVNNYDGSIGHDWLKEFEQHFESAFEGWHRIEKVTVFFRKVFDVQCFINPELKSAILFTTEMDLRRMHYLQCSIPAFLPWYFDPEKGMTELEKKLIYSLREKTSDEYERCIGEIAKKYDFNGLRIRKMLTGFEKRSDEKRRREVERQIENIIYNINEMNSRISSYLEQKHELEITMLGLDTKLNQTSEENEIMDYFLTNKHLFLKSVNESTMKFIVKAPMDYFDEDMAKRFIDNDGSYFYRNCRGTGGISYEDMKMLMQAIFIEQELKVQFCAAYKFNLEGNVSAIEGFDFGPEFNDYMPNPHIDKYSCLGDHLRIINEILKRNDYIGAIEQSIASCKSLNLADAVVMQEFVATICGKNRKNNHCIVLPDGKVVTPVEAIAWLHENMNNEGEEN